jgi:hypothetical protein
VVFSLGSVLFVYVAMRAGQQRGNAFFSSRNQEVLPLGSVPRTSCNGKIILFVQPELQEGEVGRSRHT